MLIDWFTVGAQTLNFLVLVWLLKRFLYKPVLDAIDTREQGIVREIVDAQARKAEATAEQLQYQQKNRSFESDRAAMLKLVTNDAATEREGLLNAARQAADALRVKSREALASEHLTLSKEISRRTCAEVMAIVRKALTDLAGAALDERIGVVFMARLSALSGVARAQLVTALQGSANPVLVRSAFVLPATQRDAIQATLDAIGGSAVPVRFETAEELIGGIELSADGRKFAWSIADYLGGLEKSIAVLLETSGSEPTSISSPTPTPTPVGAPARPAESTATSAP